MYEVLLKDDNRDNTDESASASSATEQTNTATQTTAEQQPATAPQRAEKFDELLDTDKEKTEKTDDAQDNTATDVYSRYRDKVAARGSARMALAEMMRPEDQSRRERNLRRVALGQALGEIIGGLFGFGIAQKNGSSVVVPESQATKTQQRLLKLQEQGLADREQYRTMLAKLRMDNLDKELAEERWLTGQEITRAERDAARAHQAELLDKKLEAEKTRRQQKDEQWQTRHDETVRHNKAMEANGRRRGSGRGTSQYEDNGDYASYLRPSERLVTRITDDGSIIGGKKTTTYRQRLPGMTKEERKRWNAIASGIIHDLGYDDASDVEISALLAPLQRLLSGVIDESAVRDLIHEYPQSYDIFAEAARNGLPLDDESLASIRRSLADGTDVMDVINDLRAISVATNNKNQ